MTEPQILKIGKQLAVLSAVVGSLILAIFIITRNGEMMHPGFYYPILAGIINGAVLVSLGLTIYFARHYWRKIIATMIFMLSNIPLSIIYNLIAVKLL